MRSLSQFILTALLVSAALLCAQDVAQNSPSTSSPAIAGCDADQFEPGPPLEILSDTTGADFGQYLRDVTRQIRINFHRAIAPDTRSSSPDKACATVEFSIEKDGKLTGVKLVQSSGNAMLERSAEAGITASAPFPPLPEQFAGRSLTLRFHFRYNPQRGRLTPIPSQGGEWHSAADNTGPADAESEPTTYQGEPVYRVGQGVKAPKATYMPDPEYTEQARKKKLQGTVVLQMVVTREGNVDDVKIVRGFDPGLDQKAVDTVRRWRFNPGTKEGNPVNVQISAEVSFKLY